MYRKLLTFLQLLLVVRLFHNRVFGRSSTEKLVNTMYSFPPWAFRPLQIPISPLVELLP